MRKILQCLALIVLAAALSSPSGAQDAAKGKPKNFLAAALADVALGDPVQSDQLILFPLIVKTLPEPLPVVPGRAATKLAIVEPTWPERRFNIQVGNGESSAVLLFGGSILVGGRIDRMLPGSLLVPAGAILEVQTLPAESLRSYRAREAPFRHGATVAPVYLRSRAARSPSYRLVPNFVSHFLEFRPESDKRRSLAAIDESPTLAKFCLACQAALSRFPDVAGKRVVGFVTAVHGRIHSVELFGTNELLRTYFEPLLRAHTYAAAAIELRAQRVGFPMPKTDAAAVKKAGEMATELLQRLKTKAQYRKGRLPGDTVGDGLLLRAGGTSGQGLGYEGRLVHAAIFPYNPFESRLYSKPLLPPGQGGEDDPESIGELERREESGRPTEYEQRLLDRIRERRGGQAPRGR